MMETVAEDLSSPLTFRCLFAAFVASVGSGFQHGYNTGMMNAPQEVVESWLQALTDNETAGGNLTTAVPSNLPLISTTASPFSIEVTMLFSYIVTIYLVGGMIGSFITNLWMNTFGLKWGIVSNNVLVFVSSALMGFSKTANSYCLLLIGRFIVGINSGLNAGLVPMYLTEISPVRYRGAIGSLYQLFVTVSIMIAEILGMSTLMGTETQWPNLFFVISLLGLLQIILLPFCADSPKYLVCKGREEAAIRALKWHRGTEEVGPEVENLKKAFAEEKIGGQFQLKDLLKKVEHRKALTISMVIMAGQQLSGINAIIYYSTATFKQAALGNYAELGTMLIGIVNVLITIISVLLVDLTGRKKLLIFGFASMCVDTILLCVALSLATSQTSATIASYLCVLFLVLYIVFFASGIGSIPWFLSSELFAQQARPAGISIAAAFNWLVNILVAITFLPLQMALGPYVFIIFAVLQFCFMIYIIFQVPETKNKKIHEITAILRGDVMSE